MQLTEGKAQTVPLGINSFDPAQLPYEVDRFRIWAWVLSGQGWVLIWKGSGGTQDKWTGWWGWEGTDNVHWSRKMRFSDACWQQGSRGRALDFSLRSTKVDWKPTQGCVWGTCDALQLVKPCIGQWTHKPSETQSAFLPGLELDQSG